MQLRNSLLICAAGVWVLATGAAAKDKKAKAAPKEPQDAIEVVGHVPLTDGPVKRFLVTQHYSSYYLYAEHDAGKNVTLIDVTKAARPSVLADVSYSAGGGSSNLIAVAGTAALTGGEQTASQAAPQTIRIMDFSEPRQPKVAREFKGVTAISRDERRGLIYLANAEGIWILRQTLAEDPEVEKAYAHQVLYDH